jgi:acetyl/propionyl-CoA carboxylase alpha subunit
MRIALRRGEHHLVLDVQHSGDSYRVRDGSQDRTIQVEPVGTNGLLIDADGKRRYVNFAREGDTLYLSIAGEQYTLTREQSTIGHADTPIVSPDIVAPMPGKVIQVLVQRGAHVAGGDTIVILEAMKMETRLLAEAAGIVEAVHVASGDLVEGGKVLAVIRYDESRDGN